MYRQRSLTDLALPPRRRACRFADGPFHPKGNWQVQLLSQRSRPALLASQPPRPRDVRSGVRAVNWTGLMSSLINTCGRGGVAWRGAESQLGLESLERRESSELNCLSNGIVISLDQQCMFWRMLMDTKNDCVLVKIFLYGALYFTLNDKWFEVNWSKLSRLEQQGDSCNETLVLKPTLKSMMRWTESWKHVSASLARLTDRTNRLRNAGRVNAGKKSKPIS